MRSIIISNNNILLKSLSENACSENNFTLISPTELSNLASAKIIKLLILDSNIINKKDIIPFAYKIKTIISLLDQQVFKQELYFQKPFKLCNLIDLINQVRVNQKLFYPLNEDFIYDEELKLISTRSEKIKLTDKENEVLKALLIDPEFSLTRLKLLEDIWGYHKGAESNTIETHLYRLKQKLPNGMLQIKEGVYNLNISS